MKIINALFIAGNVAFYFDDQNAIKQSKSKDGFFDTGDSINWPLYLD